LKVKSLVLIAVMAALSAAGAFIRIPVPLVPFTLQTLFCVLSGILLGPKRGAVAQAVYVLIGLAGVPVFTQGGGFMYVLKPSFGYLLGFIAGAYVAGFVYERLELGGGYAKMFAACLAGLAPIYLIGVPYLYIICRFYLGMTNGPATVGGVLISGFLMFIPGDAASCALVSFAGKSVVGHLRRMAE